METTNFVPSENKTTVNNMSNFEGKFNLDKSGFNPNMPGYTSNYDMVLRQPSRTVKKEGAGIGLFYEIRNEMALMLDDHMCALTVALH